MTAALIAALTDRIQQAVRLDEIQACADQIDICYHQEKILEQEHQDLLDTYKKQLKLVLDLNLLPAQSTIDASLEQQSIVTAKADSAEITAEEFQIIEKEAVRLNRARLDYIQEHFFSHTSSLPVGYHYQTKSKRPNIWKKVQNLLKLR